jgi:hypothetical protein
MFILQDNPRFPLTNLRHSVILFRIDSFFISTSTNDKHIHHFPNSDSYKTIRFCHLVLFLLHCFHLTRSKMTLLCLLYSNSILLIKMYIACIYSLTATSKEETELAAGPCINSRISLVDFEF